jgi:hypothetical protein
MPHSIETLASTRRKTKETIRVESLVPSQLRSSSTALIGLLKDYYSHLNEIGQTSYELNSINNSRDIDLAENKYIDLIQKEIAASIPKTLQNQILDKVKLYKNLMQYYSVRGSSDSIVLFFKILFDDTAEVYYPKNDMLIPSSGTWDRNGRRPIYDQLGNRLYDSAGNPLFEPGIYTSNKGFLSDTIKIQDSYFYQQFSYVIRTGNNVDAWSNPFNKLVHPAGFIFFGEIVIYLENSNFFTVLDINNVDKDSRRIFSSMRRLQPGLIGDEDLPVNVFVGMPDTQALISFPKKYRLDEIIPPGAEPYLRTAFTTAGKFTNIKFQVTAGYVGTEFTVLIDQIPIKATNSEHRTMLKTRYNSIAHFFDPGTSMYSYANYTVQDTINNVVPWNNVGSEITISSIP